MASEEPRLLQGCSERGINLWQKLLAAPSAFVLLPRAETCVIYALGKHRELGKWCGRSPLRSPSTEIPFSQQGERVNVSVCTLPWAHPQCLVSEDPGKTGAIPIMATDVGMVSSKLGLAKTARQFGEPKMGLCMLISTSWGPHSLSAPQFLWACYEQLNYKFLVWETCFTLNCSSRIPRSSGHVSLDPFLFAALLSCPSRT